MTTIPPNRPEVPSGIIATTDTPEGYPPAQPHPTYLLAFRFAWPSLMIITEEEILEAVGRPIGILRASQGDKCVEITAAPPRQLWKHETEEAARAGLLAAISARAIGYSTISFRIWPETGSRPDGKWSGYARASFS